MWRRITISIVPLRKLGNLSLLLFLSLLFSSLQHFSFLSSTILVRFLLSRRGKRRGRKSSHRLFFVATRILLEARRIPRRGCSASRQREREEARACVSPIKARSEREIGTVGRQGTSVRNENGSLHLLEEQRRPRLLHGIASIIPVGAYLPGL